MNQAELQDKFKNFNDNNSPSYEANLTDIETASKIRELQNIPPVKDMPAVMSRAVFKNDRQRLAAVKLHKRHIKFNDNKNEAALRAWCASTIGLGGLGRFESVMAAVGLWETNSYRIARGLPKQAESSNKILKGGGNFEEKDETNKGFKNR
jgi:hypothetical protein